MKNKKVTSAIIIFSVGHMKKNSSEVLLIKEKDGYRIPTVDVGEDETTAEAASRLAMTISSFSAKSDSGGWIDLVQLPIVERNGEDLRENLIVPYFSFIPKDTFEIKNNDKLVWVDLLSAYSEKFVDGHESVMANFKVKI